MRKYLITGALALVTCATLTSCHNDDDLAGGSIATAKIDAFDKNFVSAYGEIQSGHTWGFGAASPARTRSGESWGEVIKPDMTNFPGYSVERTHRSDYRSPEGYADIVEPITDKEREWVMDWFSKNPGLSDEGLDIQNFFVQDVGNNGHTKQGYFYNSETGTEVVTAQSYEGIQMDKLQIGPTASEADTEHTLDFNATTGFNEWNLIYYKNCSALQFGYHESYGSSYEWYFKCVELEVPGSCFSDGVARKNWYVGLSYYCDKRETDQKRHIIGGDSLQYANDWVLKIVPGKGDDNPPTPSKPNVKVVTSSTTSTVDYKVIKYSRVSDIGRVMAEDLGSSQRLDMDFNDVVFEARVVDDILEIRATKSGESGYSKVSSVTLNGQTYNAGKTETYTNIKLLAAGGTIPITVAGVNVHAAFDPQAGETTMVNTRNPEMTNGTYAERNPADLRNPSKSGDNIYKFDYSRIDDIPIGAKFMNDVIKVVNGDNYENVPHKLRVPTDAAWPIERVDMNAAFSNKFGGNDGYVQNEKVRFWQEPTEGKTNNLPGFNTPAGTTFDERQITSGTIYGQSTYQVSNVAATNDVPTVDSDYTIKGESTVSSTNPGYLYTDYSAHNVYLSGDNFSDIAAGTKIRVYGVYNNGYTPSVSVSSLGSASFNSQGSYFEFDVDTNEKANAIKSSGLTISGSNFTVTNVAVKIGAFQPQQTEYEIPARKGTVIWSGSQETSWGSGVIINTDKFSGAATGSKIRVYGVGLEDGGNSWQVALSQNIDGWPAIPGTETQTYWTKGNVEGGVELEWTLTAEGAAAVTTNQTVVRGPNFTVKYITIENPEPAPTPGGGGNDEKTEQATVLSTPVTFTDWGTEIVTLNDGYTYQAGDIFRVYTQYEERVGWGSTEMKLEISHPGWEAEFYNATDITGKSSVDIVLSEGNANTLNKDNRIRIGGQQTKITQIKIFR